MTTLVLYSLTTVAGSGCVYSGQTYSEGQTWKDGCKFDCTCVDGSTGKYQCSQLYVLALAEP